MIPGVLGFLWLIVWRWLYHPPEAHPRVSQAELQMIAADKIDLARSQPAGHELHWRDLLKLPQTWGTIVAKTFTDPVWFFITEWFPIYLVAKGIDLRNGPDRSVDPLHRRRSWETFSAGACRDT